MIYSLVSKRIEDLKPGEFSTGVTRFDRELRRVFPEMVSVTPSTLPRLDADHDVVITDNHLSLLVPPSVPCIVVHHGCAQTHYQRDETWRTAATKQLVIDQAKIFRLPNRLYVAPSAWVRSEFARHNEMPEDYARVIVHWVPIIERPARPAVKRPMIIGDWRDVNKGRDVWPRIAELMPECEFRPLNFRTDAERIAVYQAADVYLCLSLSEGGSYAFADAEAAGLLVVSTNVGNAAEFGAVVISRELSPHGMSMVLQGRLRDEHWSAPTYFHSYTFDGWAASWRQAVADARRGGPALK